MYVVFLVGLSKVIKDIHVSFRSLWSQGDKVFFEAYGTFVYTYDGTIFCNTNICNLPGERHTRSTYIR